MIHDFRIIPHAFRNCILLFLALTTSGFTAVVNSPSQDAVNAAKSAPLISYNRTYSGGAYTNGAWFGGASVVLAVASHAGNTSADARLLEQIRHLLVGTNAICANGGYPAQHERHARRGVGLREGRSQGRPRQQHGTQEENRSHAHSHGGCFRPGLMDAHQPPSFDPYHDRAFGHF